MGADQNAASGGAGIGGCFCGVMPIVRKIILWTVDSLGDDRYSSQEVAAEAFQRPILEGVSY